jgi:DNA replication protein DnaC
MLSQRYERGSTMVTSNLPFQEWTEVLGSERLTGALGCIHRQVQEQKHLHRLLSSD